MTSLPTTMMFTELLVFVTCPEDQNSAEEQAVIWARVPSLVIVISPVSVGVL